MQCKKVFLTNNIVESSLKDIEYLQDGLYWADRVGKISPKLKYLYCGTYVCNVCNSQFLNFHYVGWLSFES